MDDSVRQAMAKWPNVPHCYGWLALDARGGWRMRDEAAQQAGSAGDRIANEALLGFITVLAAPLPRYAEPVAMCESFFVARAYRRTGAGLRLLRTAERKAKEIGSRGLIVNAPYAGRLFEVLPRLGYGEAARIFFKRVQ